MVNQKYFVFLVFIAVILSAFSIFILYQSSDGFLKVISGHATSTGEANVTVETIVSINFTTSQISWGSGRVSSGFSSAGLNTYETGNVTNGNWTLTTRGGLRLENIGNVNVSLNLSATKTALTMIGGSNPTYMWNISNVDAQSCRNSTGGALNALPLNNFYNPNLTTTEFCRFFQFNDTQDSMRIDFNMTIPSDSFTGALGDTITATAFAAPY